jgi:hypothetical protein
MKFMHGMMPGHVTEVLTPLLELHWDEHTKTKLPAKQHSKTMSAPGKWRGVDPSHCHRL